MKHELRRHVAPQGLGLLEGLRLLWAERSLAWVLIRQELRSRYLGSSLGGAWNWIMPLLMLGVYALVFGGVLKARWPMARSESAVEFVATLFAGLLVVNVFAEMVGRAPGVLAANANLIKKMVFPVELLPVSLAGVALFNGLLSLLLLMLLLGLVDGQVWAAWWVLPVVLVPVVIQGLGVAWAVSACAVFVRDTGPLVQAALAALVFLTPVFYPLTAVPESWRDWVLLNPLTSTVEQLRAAAIYGVWPDPVVLVRDWLLSLVMALSGLWLFRRLRDGFADVL